MMQFTRRELVIVGFFIAIVLVFVGVKQINSSLSKPMIEIKKSSTTYGPLAETGRAETESQMGSDLIIVDVCGAVRNPGIVKLKKGDRVDEAIKAAGGLLETADRKKVNLARQLQDGEQIYIPTLEENYEQNIGANTNVSNKININTATAKELENLNGIGKALAERIVQYRQENGLFKDIKDIMKVTGIGEKKFKQIEGEIIVY